MIKGRPTTYREAFQQLFGEMLGDAAMPGERTRIEIQAVANGYVVGPAYDPSRGAAIINKESDLHVFESLESLLAFVAAHFART